MRASSLVLSASLLLFAAALSACSAAQQAASKAGADAKNAVSPIVGSWKLNGDTPPPRPNLPQFVRLDFKPDGRLEASYVAAGGALAAVLNTPSKLKTEHDSYTLDDGKHLSIVEGSRSLDYTYDVRDGKLFMTSNGDSTATVYRNANS